MLDEIESEEIGVEEEDTAELEESWLEPNPDPLPDSYFLLDRGVIDTPKWRLSPVSRDIVVDESAADDIGLLFSRLAVLLVPEVCVYMPKRVPAFEYRFGEGVDVGGGYWRY